MFNVKLPSKIIISFEIFLFVLLGVFLVTTNNKPTQFNTYDSFTNHLIKQFSESPDFDLISIKNITEECVSLHVYHQGLFDILFCPIKVSDEKKVELESMFNISDGIYGKTFIYKFSVENSTLKEPIVAMKEISQIIEGPNNAEFGKRP